MDISLRPMLQVNVSDCGGELRQLSGLFASSLVSGNLSELAQINGRIAKAACTGRLAEHPVAMGIMVQCLDLIDRRERGINSLKHPRKMGDLEQSLVEEAATLLATNGANSAAMKELGLSKLSTLRTHGKVDNLLSQSLPCPCIALVWPDVFKDNLHLIDSIIPRSGEKPRRRMVLSFDSTYLLPLQAPMRLHGKKGLVGSPFQTSDIESEEPGCFQEVVIGKEIREKAKANRMLLGCIWVCVCE